jgi:hypothetical protein
LDEAQPVPQNKTNASKMNAYFNTLIAFCIFNSAFEYESKITIKLNKSQMLNEITGTHRELKREQ